VRSYSMVSAVILMIGLEMIGNTGQRDLTSVRIPSRKMVPRLLQVIESNSWCICIIKLAHDWGKMRDANIGCAELRLIITTRLRSLSRAHRRRLRSNGPKNNELHFHALRWSRRGRTQPIVRRAPHPRVHGTLSRGTRFRLGCWTPSLTICGFWRVPNSPGRTPASASSCSVTPVSRRSISIMSSMRSQRMLPRDRLVQEIMNQLGQDLLATPDSSELTRGRALIEEQFPPELIGAPCSGRRASNFGLFDYRKILASFPRRDLSLISVDTGRSKYVCEELDNNKGISRT